MMDTIAMSPIFDAHNFLFDENWELSIPRDIAEIVDPFLNGFEEDIDGFPIVSPASNELDELLDWSIEATEHKIVHHDCMWAGRCDDKLHPGNGCSALQTQTYLNTVDNVPPGRSLLLVQRKKSRARTVSPPPRPETPIRPDTPLSLDEEEPPQFRHQVDLASTARRLIDCSAVAADHSYTLIKPPNKHSRLENLGVQTPSDSEEEIDVVSLGDKTVTASTPSACRTPVGLPTNPSVYDRHELQRTVATAISRPREPISRKTIGRTPPKRGRRTGAGRRGRGSPAKRRSRNSSDSESDPVDVEKRSLHNDMERMRRIGLKNLFDELKLQVPSTRDKERAPKVVILREAAALCRRLANEDRERENLLRTQSRLLARVRRLRTQLAVAHRP